jgi:iron complex transport system ATP-binding protein
MNRETIRLEHLTIGYINKKTVKTVATNICAGINSGQLTCLLGANGVGKSTLLRTLSAFQSKLSGSIIITDNQDNSKGREIATLTDKQLARTLSVVLTEKPQIENMTVEELVALGRSPYTGFWGKLGGEDRSIVAEAIERVNISALTHRMVNTLSDGERQKVMIAKALAQQTPIIFLDEPTAFLDFPSKVETMLLLRQLCREADKTIFLSTHDLELALQTADTIWLMSRKEPLHIGTPQQLADDGSLKRFVEGTDGSSSPTGTLGGVPHYSSGIHFDCNTLTIRIGKL